MKVRLEEALTPEQKKDVDTWDQPHHSFSDHAFPSPSHLRTTIPVGSFDKGQHEDEIGKHLAKHGMEIHDYRQGLAKDKHGRLVKIGKALGKTGGEHLLEKFTGDPSRAAKDTASDHVITISRHPHDVAGMTSGGHSWENQSCMNFTDGSNRRYLPNDVEHGTHVAYYHHRDDKEMEKPLARIALKPFQSKTGRTILHPESRSYGNAPNSFSKTVYDWADKHFGIKDDDPHVYTRNKRVYDDSGTKIIGGLGSLAEASKQHGDSGVRDILAANKHKITEKHLDDLVPDYFEHSAIHENPKLNQKHVDWILHNAHEPQHGISHWELDGILNRVTSTHRDKVSKNAIDHLLQQGDDRVSPDLKDNLLTHKNAPAHAVRNRIIGKEATNFDRVAPIVFSSEHAANDEVHDSIKRALSKHNDFSGVTGFNYEGMQHYASNNHLHHDDIEDLIGVTQDRIKKHLEDDPTKQVRGATSSHITDHLINGLANNSKLSKEQAHKVLSMAEGRAGKVEGGLSPFESTKHGTLFNLAQWHAHKDPVLANRLVGHITNAFKGVASYVKGEAASVVGVMQAEGALSKEHQHAILKTIGGDHHNTPDFEKVRATDYLINPEHNKLHPDIRKNILDGVYGQRPKSRMARLSPLSEDEQGKLKGNDLMDQIEHHPVHKATWDWVVSHEDPTVRSSVAAHKDLPHHHLATLLNDANDSVRMNAVLNTNIHKHLDTLIEGHDRIGLGAVFTHGKDRHFNRLLERAHESSEAGAYITNKFANRLNHVDTWPNSDLTPEHASKVAHAIVHHHDQGRTMLTDEFIKGLKAHHGEQPFWIMHQHATELEKKSKPRGAHDINHIDNIREFLASNKHTPHDIFRKMKFSKNSLVSRKMASNPGTPEDVLEHMVKHHPDKDTAWRAYREQKRRGLKVAEPEARFESITNKTRVYLLG